MDKYDDNLPPSEAAREKRRDRDAEAHARAGMKTGLAKQFKQVLDAQARRARELEPDEQGDATRPKRRGSRGGPPGQPPNVNA